MSNEIFLTKAYSNHVYNKHIRDFFDLGVTLPLR